MPPIDPRNTIATALSAFGTLPLPNAARGLLAALGYSGTRTVSLTDVDDFLATFDPDDELRRRNKAMLGDWHSASLLFQLTDDDLSGQDLLFTSTDVDKSLTRSYLFFHIALKGTAYPRAKLAQITRQINRLFQIPVMVLFTYDGLLSIAVINRRPSKINASKDVLGKVTLIHGIHCASPHRGHLDILASFSIPELARRGNVGNFDALHSVLQDVFNVELLNRIFYRKIQTWFFWAVQEISFPEGGIADPNPRNRIAAIRMLTRIIFCWFAREKRLIPTGLFTEATAKAVLKSFDPLSRTDSIYYTAILQNLFFPTLSVPLDRREFRNGRRFKGINKHYMDHAFFRHESAFSQPEEDMPRLFEKVPFLNGGLFACLDYKDEHDKEVRVDGFSDEASKQPTVPNILFFGKEVPVNISTATGEENDTTVKVDGLFTILDAFKFTVVENTPVEEEIALDPELLGRIFENLLAEYNPETEKTARKQTGSFYTPRPVVDYMVTEALKSYLMTKVAPTIKVDPTILSGSPLATESETGLSRLHSKLDILFEYTEREHAFSSAEKHALVDAIYDAAILDPACGSGAFPMGMLQKLVYVLGKLDHSHTHWKDRILAGTPPAVKEETRKWLESGSADFTWKLGIIQHSIYGVDIQPFAVQIAKLRCFVSLLVDFDVDPAAENSGVPALPNLDFKFVAANTLIKPPSDIEHADNLLGFEDPFLEEFAKLAENFFFVRDPAEKKKLQEGIESIIERQIDAHTDTRAHRTNSKAARVDAENKRKKTLWESYRNIFAFRNKHVEFFDPRYFFPEIKNGFDIVIGNPPYVRADEQSEWNQIQRKAILACNNYETLWEKWDLFVPFIERSYNLLKPGGVCALIVSDAFCHSKYAQKSQKWLLANSRILRLDFCGNVKIFDAAVHNVIPFIQKADGKDNIPERRLHVETFGNVSLLPSDQQLNLTYRAFFPEDAEFKVFPSITRELGSLCYISYGLAANSDEKRCKGEFVTEDVVQDIPDDTHPKRYIEGKDIRQWFTPVHRFLEWGTARAPRKFRRQTFVELHEALEKLMTIVVTGGQPPVMYDTLQRFTTHTSCIFVPWHSLSGVRNNSLKKAAHYLGETPPRPDLPRREELEATSDRFSVKYLLGVMNSSSARDFLRANRRSNIHLYPDDWKKLPIPDITPEQQAPIIDLVDRILASKGTACRAPTAADITALESEIDRLVHALYHLTPDESEVGSRKGQS